MAGDRTQTFSLAWRFLAASGAAATLLTAYRLAQTAATLPASRQLMERLVVSLLGMGTALCVRQALRSAKASHSYGSAAFARPEELADLVVPEGAALPPASVLLGRTRAGRIALPPPFTGQHGIIVGGSGTGKSYSFFLPNMAFGQGVSCVATDPKSELFFHTSGYHRRATRFAPNEPDASAAFNWIPLCGDARLSALCARAVVEAGETEKQEAPWPDLETAFLSALFSHASTLAVPTPLTAYRLLTRTNPGPLLEMFLRSDSAVAREQAVIFQQTHERMRGSITPVLASKLQWLRLPQVERFTSASLAPPDFGRLRVSPEALFWCVREQDIALLRPLSAIFYTVLLEQLAAEGTAGTERKDAPQASSPVPVHLYLDEFANIGIIPHYETTISLARGRGLSIWHGIQSLSQLEACYGRANAQTILTNCGTKILLHGLDVETAEYVSRSLGEGTAVVARRAYQGRRWSPFASSISDSVQEHVRRLLTADEVRRIAADQALVITGNRRPMLLDKSYYGALPCPAFVSPLGSARSLPISFPGTSSVPPFTFPSSIASTAATAGMPIREKALPEVVADVGKPLPPFPSTLRFGERGGTVHTAKPRKKSYPCADKHAARPRKTPQCRTSRRQTVFVQALPQTPKDVPK